MINKEAVKAAGKKVSSSKADPHKAGNKKIIKAHQQAAAHYMEAARQHLAAAKHYEDGNAEKAVHSTVMAYGHDAIAGGFVSDAAKHHAQELKQTNYGL